MAIQAQLCKDNNLGFGLGLPVGASQDWVGDSGGNGCGFNDSFFNVNQKQEQQRQQLFQICQNQNQNQFQQQQQQQQLLDRNGILVSDSTSNNNINNLYFEKQRREIDEYVRLQNERFRFALLEQRRQQLQAVASEIERRALVSLAEKDHVIATAAKRAAELENLVAKLEMENQAWQRVARDNEATVVSLSNTLDQLLDQGCCVTSAEDAGSCCGGDEAAAAETEQNSVRCRSCYSGNACMVFLPCRHLSTCQACDALLDSCPVCRTVKKASIVAQIF